MAYSEAQRRASQKWDRAHLYKVTAHIPLEYKAPLEEVAAAYDKSVSRFVRDLIEEQIALYQGQSSGK